MQLDQARIAICERSWLDNLDLALHVIRSHAAGVAASALAGIVPLALVNHALIAGRFSNVFRENISPGALYWTMILVMIEAPLATAPLTLYLGQALFDDKPSARRIARDFFSCLPQLLLLQAAARAVLVFLVVTWFVPYVLWPYTSEVILLERNPLTGGRGGISTLARNGILHRGNTGDFLLRAIGALFLAPLLILAILVSLDFVSDSLLGFTSGWTAQLVALQAAFWLVTVYFTVARFLGYLDQRIRSEGWEVELFLRAERERLMGQIA